MRKPVYRAVLVCVIMFLLFSICGCSNMGEQENQVSSKPNAFSRLVKDLLPDGKYVASYSPPVMELGRSAWSLLGTDGEYIDLFSDVYFGVYPAPGENLFWYGNYLLRYPDGIPAKLLSLKYDKERPALYYNTAEQAHYGLQRDHCQLLSYNSELKLTARRKIDRDQIFKVCAEVSDGDLEDLRIYRLMYASKDSCVLFVCSSHKSDTEYRSAEAIIRYDFSDSTAHVVIQMPFSFDVVRFFAKKPHICQLALYTSFSCLHREFEKDILLNLLTGEVIRTYEQPHLTERTGSVLPLKKAG